MKKAEIKDMSNAKLIDALCRLYAKETKTADKIIQQICEELATRGVISTADELYKELNG